MTAEWMLGLALVVLPMMLLVAVLPGWAERHAAVGVAAREAARAAALAPTPVEAEAAAEAAAAEALALRGFALAESGGGPGPVTVRLPPTEAGGRMPREGAIEVHVHLRGQTFRIPALGDLTPPTVTGHHVRRLDDWRSR